MSLLTIVILSSAIQAQSPPPPPPVPPQRSERRVFLNGEAINDVVGLTITDMKVTITATGDIYLENAALQVLRRPGAAPQVVRREIRPYTGQVFMVAERNGLGAPAFSVALIVNGAVVATLDGEAPRVTLDISKTFHEGKNEISFRVTPTHRPNQDINTGMDIAIGLGKSQGQTLAIDRVITRFQRTSAQTDMLRLDKTVELK